MNIAEIFETEEKIVEMLKREVSHAPGLDLAQRERWVLIRRQFKISKQLNSIEEKLDKLLQ